MQDTRMGKTSVIPLPWPPTEEDVEECEGSVCTLEPEGLCARLSLELSTVSHASPNQENNVSVMKGCKPDVRRLKDLHGKAKNLCGKSGQDV